MNTTVREAGILLHPTSLPGRHGTGDLGAGARAFVDFLQRSGVSMWQILPLVPPGPGASPYSSPSAMAGNVTLIELDGLVRDGLLSPDDVVDPGCSPDAIDFAVVEGFKQAALHKAARALVSADNHPLREQREQFARDNAWAANWALFRAIRQREDRPFWEWPDALRDRDPDELQRAREALHDDVEDTISLQFLFDRQWRALRDVCRGAGVRVIGDVPLYVDADSADVWTHREVFQLDPSGRPTALSGAPPDPFSDVGQLWGNPLYDWEQQRQTGHAFWIERLRRTLDLVDVVRIDHFRGLSQYWEVPQGAPDARSGRWRPGPGKRLFDDLEGALGTLPLIAEDLGLLDDDVHELRRAVGLPGMKVLQFAFGDGPDNPYLPHHHSEDSVAYTGTHDNDTTVGWWNASPQHVRDHVRRYLATSGEDIAFELVRTAFASVARWAVVPMQDLLGLDGGSRMNKPGLAEGNWAWRVRAAAFNDQVAGRLREMLTLYGRVTR